ncbi:hypothetical protein [Paenibacillus sp. FSL M7-1046]|uniref:hypothetical protein n=1 Tax=Paenibacillus sp. FSL M7-1046 TaxID=2975315 RepID=UPI0030FC4FCE
MERTGIHSEYQDITAAAAPEQQLHTIEVTDKVMARIRTLDQKSDQKQGPRGIRFAGKTAATSGMLVMLLLITVTAYAATEYIQIRNKAGEVKVQHQATDPNWGKAAPAPYYQYMHKLMDFAEPGELIAYFFRGEALPEGAVSALQFKSKDLELNDYPALLAEMNKLNLPILPKEAKGYTFTKGKISPLGPSDAEISSNPLYRQTLNELIAEARQNTGRNLFMKILPWTKAGWFEGVYTKQGANISISATPLYGGYVQFMQDDDAAAEKLEVAGREIVYNRVVKPYVSYHYLSWYNEKQDAYYTVSTYGNRTLTKEQLLELAAELIQGGL